MDLSQAAAHPRHSKLLADWWTNLQTQTTAVFQDEEGLEYKGEYAAIPARAHLEFPGYGIKASHRLVYARAG